MIHMFFLWSKILSESMIWSNVSKAFFTIWWTSGMFCWCCTKDASSIFGWKIFVKGEYTQINRKTKGVSRIFWWKFFLYSNESRYSHLRKGERGQIWVISHVLDIEKYTLILRAVHCTVQFFLKRVRGQMWLISDALDIKNKAFYLKLFMVEIKRRERGQMWVIFHSLDMKNRLLYLGMFMVQYKKKERWNVSYNSCIGYEK